MSQSYTHGIKEHDAYVYYTMYEPTKFNLEANGWFFYTQDTVHCVSYTCMVVVITLHCKYGNL